MPIHKTTTLGKDGVKQKWLIETDFMGVVIQAINITTTFYWVHDSYKSTEDLERLTPLYNDSILNQALADHTIKEVVLATFDRPIDKTIVTTMIAFDYEQFVADLEFALVRPTLEMIEHIASTFGNDPVYSPLTNTVSYNLMYGDEWHGRVTFSAHYDLHKVMPTWCDKSTQPAFFNVIR